MIEKENILRKEIKSYKNVNLSGFICACKNCKKEVWIQTCKLPKSTGFCYSCSRKTPKVIPISGTKACSKCKKDLNLEAFHLRKDKSRLHSMCLRCMNLCRYKINSAEYDNLVSLQNGVCAICKQSDDINLAVDHCHTTNKIRGLLCVKCNKAL
jgi:hypothetical protein